MRNAPLTPLPMRGTDTGLMRVLSVMTTAPDSEPIAGGENVTVIVQFSPIARLAPQLFVSAKLPLAAMLLMLNCTLLGLLRVIVCDGLVVPTP